LWLFRQAKIVVDWRRHVAYFLINRKEAAMTLQALREIIADHGFDLAETLIEQEDISDEERKVLMDEWWALYSEFAEA
jgi:hypothetical protein